MRELYIELAGGHFLVVNGLGHDCMQREFQDILR